MKAFVKLLALCGAVWGMSLCAHAADPVNIIPRPMYVSQTEGQFRLTAKTVIGYDAALKPQAEYLAEKLSGSTGWDFQLKENARKADILLTLRDEADTLKPEAYRLSVSRRNVQVVGADAAGVFYGIQSLLQLFPAFQQPVRFKGIQVLDLIRIAANKNLSPADACKYLSEVGLCAKDYINREVNASLSGGELKRIEIATVLARGTQLSIFDEPEAGIDLWSFQNLIQVFERMQEKNQDGSILIISHQERILNIADEIVVIADGQIVNHGPKEEILPTLLGTSSAVNVCNKFQQGGVQA